MGQAMDEGVYQYPWIVDLPRVLSTRVTNVVFCRMSWRDPDKSLKCSRGMAMRCSGQNH
jgi:hypothetical protein